MGDHVERHKSQRWVRTEGNSYNDWNDSDDDYEYEDDSSGFDHGNRSAPSMPPLPDLNKLNISKEASQALNAHYDNELSKPKDSGLDTLPANASASPMGNSPLVLSIDNIHSDDDNDDDDDDNDDDNEDVDYDQEELAHSSNRNDMASDDDIHDEFEDSRNTMERSISPVKFEAREDHVQVPSLPPLTTSIAPSDQIHRSDLFYPHTLAEPSYTPTSEASYTSDADSIQYEPATLNVKPILHNNEVSTIYDIQEEGLSHAPTVRQATSNQTEPELRGNVPTYNSSMGEAEQGETLSSFSEPPKLELTIDNLQKTDDDDDSSDDDWGYNGNNTDEEPELEDVVIQPVTLVVDHQDSLHRATTPELVATHLPAPGSWNQNPGAQDSQDSIDFEQPDALNFSQNDRVPALHAPVSSDKDVSRHDTQIRGLNIVKSPKLDGQATTNVATTDHLEDLINEIHEASIRNDELLNNDVYAGEYNSSGEDLNRQYSLKSSSSIRKPPPEFSPEKPFTVNNSAPSDRLVSGDYSNIAEAVNSYMNDTPDAIPGLQSQTIHEDDENSDNETVRDGYSFEENGEVILPSIPSNTVSKSTSSNDNDQEFGISSFTPPTLPGGEKFPQPPNIGDQRPLVSRMSTMSTNTFSFGEWVPNTNNFRDEFIGHNDRDSVLPQNNRNSEQFHSFTNNNTRRDDNESINSIPETVDVRLPSIHEDHDVSTNNQSERDLTSTITHDSILSEKPYISPKFKEEKLTPRPSEDAISTKDLPQKYTSLLGSADTSTITPSKDSTSERTRSHSHSSIATAVSNTRVGSVAGTSTLSTQVTNTEFTPKSYPVFSWKDIMSSKDPAVRISKLKEALQLESQYDSGLELWLTQSLQQHDGISNIQIGKIATSAYQTATHNDIRRHQSLRSKVNIVKDKMENSGLHATSLGKRLFSRSKKLVANSTSK